MSNVCFGGVHCVKISVWKYGWTSVRLNFSAGSGWTLMSRGGVPFQLSERNRSGMDFYCFCVSFRRLSTAIRRSIRLPSRSSSTRLSREKEDTEWESIRKVCAGMIHSCLPYGGTKYSAECDLIPLIQRHLDTWLSFHGHRYSSTRSSCKVLPVWSGHQRALCLFCAALLSVTGVFVFADSRKKVKQRARRRQRPWER